MATTSPQAQISLHGVTKRFRGFTLGPVSVELPVGVHALLGANGAGKSTLLRLVVGTSRPTAGTVSVAEGMRGVGFLPQEFVGPGRSTVRDYLTYVAWCMSSRERRIGRSRIDTALEVVGLSDRGGSRIGTLSGGMVRRLGIAEALLSGSPVLVLDEPTVGLDPVQRHDARELVGRLGESACVLVSTHLAEDVVAVADSVLVLDDGRLRYTGSVAGLCAGGQVSSERLEAGFLDLVRGGDRRADGERRA